MKIMVEKIVPDEIEEYRGFTIEITRDEDPVNPREDDNVGTMCCEHAQYTLGDGDMLRLYDSLVSDSRYLQLYEELPDDESEPFAEDDYPHMLEQAEEWGYVILPLYLYDHSGITMSCEPFSCPWDSGQVGIIFCSPQKRHAESMTEDQCRKYLEGEVETYDQYLTGDVWGWEVKEGDEGVDSCWGFFGKDSAIQAAKAVIDDELKTREKMK